MTAHAYANTRLVFTLGRHVEEKVLGEVFSEFHLEGTDYALLGELGGDAILHPQLFPGLSIPVGEIWFDLP